MKIGILQTGHFVPELVPSLGDYSALYAQMLDGYDFEFQTFSVVDMDFPDGPDAADGWLISGSKHGAYEDHPWIAPLEQLIREIQASGRPMIGVCFGHQIIAQALGGKVEKFQGGWSVGATDYQFGDDTLTLNAWHQDQVTQAPDGAKLEATNDFCKIAALSYGDKIYTVQAHPEFEAAAVEGLIRTRGDSISQKDVLEQAQNKLGLALANKIMAEKLANVLRQGVKE